MYQSYVGKMANDERMKSENKGGCLSDDMRVLLKRGTW